MSNICIERSGYDDVVTVFRTWFLTPSQAYDIWGDNIPEDQLRSLASQRNGASIAAKNEYVQIETPNPAYGILEGDKCVSVVIDVKSRKILGIDYLPSLSYAVSRLQAVPGEIYGRSYLWNLMADIVMINRLSQRIKQGVDFTVWPINVFRDLTSISPNQITPGAFIQGIDSQGQVTFEQKNFVGNIAPAIDYYNIVTNQFRELTVGYTLTNEQIADMNIPAINEAKIKMSYRARPILTRLEGEFLSPLIKHLMQLMAQDGELPPFPYGKAAARVYNRETGQEQIVPITPEDVPDPIEMLQVGFSGAFTRMHELQKIQNHDMIFNKVAMAMQMGDPRAKYLLKTDKITREDAEILGMDSNFMYADDEIDEALKIEQERAEQQEGAQVGLSFLDMLNKRQEGATR